jgi:hypothetical protein
VRRTALAALIAAAPLLAACAGDDETAEAPMPAATVRTERAPQAPHRERLRPVRCPTGLSNCAEASGRIIYVERVDPDGDGDAHFVLASADSITAPGLSVIDVKRSLRPHPLPGPGDRLSAAGPVYTGSYGQRQIQAIELHTAR